MGFIKTIDAMIRCFTLMLGKDPGCAWVQLRLGAYYAWDPSLSCRKYAAIEKHLAHCPECAAEWEATCSLCNCVEQLRRNQEPSHLNSDDIASAALLKIAKYETSRSREFKSPKRVCARRWAYGLAVVCLLALGFPVLAQIGKYLVDYHKQSKDALAYIRLSDSTKCENQIVVLKPGHHAANDHSTIRYDRLNSFPAESLIELDRRFEQTLAQVQVEAMLPHTEAEWEAWARKEYPHIMWVYDVLTKPEYGINWNGKPAYIPDWAKKIWTDEVTRPAGWRALVFYSGEIFRFDYPIKPEDPNVRPTIDAMKRAAAIAGCMLQLEDGGKQQLPPLNYSDLSIEGRFPKALVSFIPISGDPDQTTSGHENKSVGNVEKADYDYADQILGDHIRLRRALIYIIITSRCIPDLRWRTLSKTCSEVLNDVVRIKYDSKSCITDEYAFRLGLVIEMHAHLHSNMKKGWVAYSQITTIE